MIVSIRAGKAAVSVKPKMNEKATGARSTIRRLSTRLCKPHSVFGPRFSLVCSFYDSIGRLPSTVRASKRYD